MRSIKSGSVKLYRFKKLVRELSAKEGRGTELVTLYIPPDRNIVDVINYLKQEYATASNIKSKTTRKNVQEAIVKAIERLKLFNSAKPNGLVIFSGALPQNGPGTEKVEVYHLIPPEPINSFSYRCDSKFYVEPLKDMMKERDVYGIVVIDNEEAAIAVAKDRDLVMVKKFTSGVPGKHRAGGQSARRFERLREQSLNEYYKRVADHANEIFLQFPNIKGIIVGGPGPTKEEFVEGDRLHYSFRNKIKIVDTSYSGENGIKEAINKASSFMEELRLIEEQKLVKEFIKEVSKGQGGAVYGEEGVLKAIRDRTAEIVLLSEDLGLVKVTVTCQSCGNSHSENVDKSGLQARVPELLGMKCGSCGGSGFQLVSSTPLIDMIIDEAERLGIRVELIGSTSEEGDMLKSAFGGIAAILKQRYH